MPCGQPSKAASIWPVWFESSSIACLPRMTSPGCSSSATLASSLATRERLDLVVGLDQDRAVGAHRERGAQRLLRLGRADRDRDDLGRDALLLEPDRLLDRDLVERVHAHLDVGEIDARPVRLDPRLDVEIDHPLDGDQELHRSSLSSSSRRKPGSQLRAPGLRRSTMNSTQAASFTSATIFRAASPRSSAGTMARPLNRRGCACPPRHWCLRAGPPAARRGRSPWPRRRCPRR